MKTDSKRRDFFNQFLGLFLIVALSLPSPAWALRAGIEGTTEKRLEEEIAAGLEEPDIPSVRGVSRTAKNLVDALMKNWFPKTGVFEPDHWSTMLMLEAMEHLGPIFAEAEVLDTGTGTGALIFHALKQLGAGRGTATDIYASVLESVSSNAGQLGITKHPIEILQGDLFDPVRGRQFDVALFNAPNAAMAESYLHHVAEILRPNGVALLMWRLDRGQKFKVIARQQNFDIVPLLNHDGSWVAYAITRTPERMAAVRAIFQKNYALTGSEKRFRAYSAGLEELDEPQIRQDNAYAAAHRALLGRPEFTEESRQRLLAMEELGPKVEAAFRKRFGDPELSVLLIPRGSALKGYANPESDVDLDIVVLYESGRFKRSGDDGIDVDILSLFKEKGFLVHHNIRWTRRFPFLKEYRDSKGEDGSGSAGENEWTEYPNWWGMPSLFLPVTYGNREWVERARRNIVLFISGIMNKKETWEWMQSGYHHTLSIDPEDLLSKPHLKRWLSSQGVDVTSDDAVENFNVARLRQIELPGLAEMAQIYQASNSTSPAGPATSQAAGLEETTERMVKSLGNSKEPITLEQVEQIRQKVLEESGEWAEESGSNPYLEGEESRKLLSDLIDWMNTPLGAQTIQKSKFHLSDFDPLTRSFEREKFNSRDSVAHAAFVPWVMGNYPVFYVGNHRTGWALMNVSLLRARAIQRPIAWEESKKNQYYETLKHRNLTPFVDLIRSYLQASSAAGLEQQPLPLAEFANRYSALMREPANRDLRDTVEAFRGRDLGVWVVPGPFKPPAAEAIAQEILILVHAAENQRSAWESVVRSIIEEFPLEKVVFKIIPYPADGELGDLDAPVVVIQQIGANLAVPSRPIPVISFQTPEQARTLTSAMLYSIAINKAVGSVVAVVRFTDGMGKDWFAVFV